MLGVFVLVGSSFVADWVSENRARQTLLNELGKSPGVVMNGKPLGDATRLLFALRHVGHVPAHHSHPKEPVKIRLVAGSNTTRWVIARDSDNPDEFWVLGPYSKSDYWWEGGQDAGHIVSRDLDLYLRQMGL